MKDQTQRVHPPVERVLEQLADRETSDGTLLVGLKESNAVRGVSVDGTALPIQERIAAESIVRAAFPGLSVRRGVLRPISVVRDDRAVVDTIYRRHLTLEGPFTAETLGSLLEHPNVDYIEVNRTDGRLLAAGTPLLSIHAPFAQSEPWSIDSIRADLAWSEGYDGNGADVAVLDTGFDLQGPNHPDVGFGFMFANFTTENGNNPCTALSQPCFWEEPYHGTGVAGALMATDNSVGSIGAAPFASGSPSALAKVVYQASGGGPRINPDDVNDALLWVSEIWDANSVDIRVGVMSFELPLRDTTDYPTLLGTLQTAAQENNVLWFAGSGNGGGEVVLPAGFSQVVAVGAVKSNLQISDFSSRGPQVELVAPGEDLRISWHRSDDDSGSLEFTRLVDGTSFAGPIAAAVARIALDKYPTWTASQLRTELQDHARDLGSAGRDNTYGYGMVDAYCILAQHDPCVPLTASLSGQTNIASEGYYSYSVSATGGEAPYSYSWEKCSISGTGCVFVGSGSSYTLWVASSEPHFLLKASVNGSDPDAVQRERAVFVNIGGGGEEAPPRRGGGNE